MKKHKPRPLFIWAGGKTKLIKHYADLIPKNINHYCEPFFGAGAFFLYLVETNNHPLDGQVIINDVNEDIINIYKVVKTNVDLFIKDVHETYEKEYLSLETKEKRKEFFYEVRHHNAFHHLEMNEVEQAAIQFFLMKTSFNGIYQINKNTNGRFGTPAGLLNQKNEIFSREDVYWWNEALNKTNASIYSTDWRKVISNSAVEKHINDFFFFFDPPYRNSFTSYGTGFDDNNLNELIQFIEQNQKAQVFLCNRLDDKDDPFFENKTQTLKTKTIDVTYTAGRRKKDQDGSFSAKKAVEILLYRTQNSHAPGLEEFM